MFSLNLGAPVSLHQQYVATQPQGTQTVLLPDGSTLSVNANTRLRIDFGAYQRDIYLDKGQLYIEVAANKEQPLVVHAGDASIRVVGTGFDVRRSQHQLVVSVAHGQVAFMPDANTSTLLGAQQRTTYDYARASTQEQNLSPGEVADWRSGHLSFRNRELASLVDELDLYRPGMIQLAEGPLGRYKVSGNLDVNDPMALVKALPALIPVKTVLLDNGKIRIEPR
ncbi:FecR family protein [Pseudomonas deceptionensis]